MPDASPLRGVEIDADLQIERVEDGTVLGAIAVSRQLDGSVKIASTGQLPSGSLQDVRRMRSFLVSFAQATGQDILIEHEGRRLAQVQCEASKNPTWSVNWLGALQFWLGRFGNRS